MVIGSSVSDTGRRAGVQAVSGAGLGGVGIIAGLRLHTEELCGVKGAGDSAVGALGGSIFIAETGAVFRRNTGGPDIGGSGQQRHPRYGD